MGLETIMETVNSELFGVWFLIGAVLVFFMQCGFAMVETGFTRAKNAGNIIMKNKYISKSCTFVSYISYGIFLLHHQLLFRVLGNFSNISFTGSVFLLMGMYVLCMISAYILTKLCNYIMHFLKNR